MESLQLATAIAKVLDKKKASDVKVLKVRDLTVLTDYFVIATGTSSTHVKSLAEEVEFQLDQQGVKTLCTEGYDSKNWILLDYGSVLVHVFVPEARQFYNLENLWADAEPVDVKFEEDETDAQ